MEDQEDHWEKLRRMELWEEEGMSQMIQEGNEETNDGGEGDQDGGWDSCPQRVSAKKDLQEHSDLTVVQHLAAGPQCHTGNLCPPWG